MSQWRRLPLLLCIFLCITVRGFAAQYQVGATRGIKTLQDLPAQLQPGDIVTVDGAATYPGGVTFRSSGTASAPIVIAGIRIDGRRPMLSGVTEKGAAVLRVLGSHYIIQGFDITPAGDPRATRCFYNVGDDVTLRDSIVHDSPMTGIAGADASGSLTLDRVEVCRCGSGLYSHQIYVGAGLAQYPRALFRMQYCYVHDSTGGNNVKSRVPRNQILCNWIEGAAFHELDLVGPDPKSQSIPPGTHCDADVIGNVLAKTSASLGTVARLGSDGTGASNGRVRFLNNTVIIRGRVAAYSGVFWLKGEIDSVTVTNNVFWSAAGSIRLTAIEHGAAPVFAGSHNWWPAGTRNIPAGWRGASGADPRFVDDANDDFHPAPGSPLIGAGMALPQSIAMPQPAGSPAPGRAAWIHPSTGYDIGAFP